MSEEALTVERYLACLQAAYSLGRGVSNDPRRKVDQAAKENAHLAWLGLRDARIYHIDPAMYGAIHQACDVYTTEEIAGLQYEPQASFHRYPTDEGNPYSPEEVDRHVSAVLRASKHAPFPEWLPFESIFFGYGKGMVLQRHQLEGKIAQRAVVDDCDGAYLIGHLVTEAGGVWEFLEVIKVVWTEERGPGKTTKTSGTQSSFAVMPCRLPTVPGLSSAGWVRTFELTPWIVPTLVQVFKDQMKVIEESPFPKAARKQMRRKKKRYGLQGGVVPPPYYILPVDTTVIRERAQHALYPSPVYQRSYRTDVEAHERCYIRRGPLPIDPDEMDRLRERGYQVFTTTDIDPVTQARLVKRQKPLKRPGEWLAILAVKIEQHMSPNDDSLPYVPACRRLKRGARSQVKPTALEDTA